MEMFYKLLYYSLLLILKKLIKCEVKGRGKNKHCGISTTRLQIRMDKKMEFGPVEYKINAKLCVTSTPARDCSPRSRFYCQLIYHSGLI